MFNGFFVVFMKGFDFIENRIQLTAYKEGRLIQKSFDLKKCFFKIELDLLHCGCSKNIDKIHIYC